MFTPAERLTSLPPYAFAVLGQRIREMTAQGLDIIRLDIGSPDLPPPAEVIDSLAAEVHHPDKHGYAGYKGTPEFCVAIAEYYQRRFDVQLDPATEVLPLIGSKEGIVNLSLAYIGPGDVSLVPDVSYPSYDMGARLAGGHTYWIPTADQEDYLPYLEVIPSEIARQAKLLWVNYPNNPTGATADLAFYGTAVDYCHRQQIILASDNPYCDVTFDNYRAPSVLQIEGARGVSIEFMSFSKTYNMAGWRLGAAVGNATVLRTLLQVKSNVDSGHFLPIYEAGITALQTPDSWIEARNQVYKQRRDSILRALPELGLHANTPKGSLYVWARVERGTGAEYAEAALINAQVCLAPGSIYGPGGNQYVRFSLGVDNHRLDEALHRLKVWYASA